jgi:hypothetical protein
VQAAEQFAATQAGGVKNATCTVSVMLRRYVSYKFRDIFFMRVLNPVELPLSSLGLFVTWNNCRIVGRIVMKSDVGEIPDKLSHVSVHLDGTGLTTTLHEDPRNFLRISGT